MSLVGRGQQILDGRHSSQPEAPSTCIDLALGWTKLPSPIMVVHGTYRFLVLRHS